MIEGNYIQNSPTIWVEYGARPTQSFFGGKIKKRNIKGYYFAGADLRILRGGGGIMVPEKASPWEISYWQAKKNPTPRGSATVSRVLYPTYTQARSHGGARGGGSAPLEKFEPPMLRCPFCRNYRYWGLSPPPGILSAPPLLTIPGYGAAYTANPAYVPGLIDERVIGKGQACVAHTDDLKQKAGDKYTCNVCNKRKKRPSAAVISPSEGRAAEASRLMYGASSGPEHAGDHNRPAGSVGLTPNLQ